MSYIRHGRSRTPEYRVWRDMHQRCRNKRNPHYHNYGGRGIIVCERWSEFASFFEDMGERPSDFHSIDRKNNNGNYTPKNCRWATKSEQCQNTRKVVYVNGLSLSENSRRLGIHLSTIRNRRRKGLPLLVPVKQRNLISKEIISAMKRDYDSGRFTMRQLAERHSVDWRAPYNLERRQGWRAA